MFLHDALIYIYIFLPFLRFNTRTCSFFPHYEFSLYAFFLSSFPCLHVVHSFLPLSRVCTLCSLSFIFHAFSCNTCAVLSHARVRFFTFPMVLQYAFFLSYVLVIFFHLSCVFPRTRSLFRLFRFPHYALFLSPFLCVPTACPRFQLFYVFTLCFHTAFSHCFHIAFLHCVFRTNIGPRDFMKLSVTI